MKEYNLIRKNGDMSHDASEVDTLMDHIHQEYQDSLNESSGGLVNTAKPSKVSKGNSSRKSKKRPVKDEESDSDFEPPSYSIKKAVNRQRRSIKRHSAMKAPVQDIEMDTLHERSNMAISEEEVHKSDDNSDKEPTLVLASQTEGEKKANNDSTHEGSI
eukprot:CAMPEP_0197016836 /NCGR_PEP_ID=MMETSP1380-20130617/79196_1 /TAXON_ID=5936 /ORGANISM="Euplotes crassus, Strain CT5" /LENGTH=158 /DNA_ID=CAMNT_0042443843 /DNA_START=106 /DNA_END=582 /DNA_ORIENTATION=+